MRRKANRRHGRNPFDVFLYFHRHGFNGFFCFSTTNSDAVGVEMKDITKSRNGWVGRNVEKPGLRPGNAGGGCNSCLALRPEASPASLHQRCGPRVHGNTQKQNYSNRVQHVPMVNQSQAKKGENGLSQAQPEGVLRQSFGQGWSADARATLATPKFSPPPRADFPPRKSAGQSPASPLPLRLK
jgi:hypothetical protein